MALLLLRTGLGIFSYLSALIHVLVARVNEVPLLILLPQVVVALDRPSSPKRSLANLLAGIRFLSGDGVGEGCS